MDRLFEVFEAHNIRCMPAAGLAGHQQQSTSPSTKTRLQLRCIGVPKTIDNDLPHTDHTPGYGGVVKYNATTVMEIMRRILNGYR